LEQTQKRVLVVDDDADTRALVVDILEEDGFSVYPCCGGEEALTVLRQEEFDLILSDIRMPRVSGIDLLLEVRRMHLNTEVILITAYASLQTAIQALRGEAFDYITKPFTLSEFRERVRQGIQNRSPARPPRDVMHFGDLSIDYTARRVWKGGFEIKLTRLEFNVLAHLFKHQGCAASRQELLESVWGCQEPDERSMAAVKSAVSRLRKKIEDDAQDPQYIKNVWGVGYQFGE
jgi:DNA-binding response OmpR family regulator